MNDWWFFIISDIVGRAQLVLSLIAFLSLFIAGLMFLDHIGDTPYNDENEYDRKRSMLIIKILTICGIALLFFSTIILPSKQAITEAYVSSRIQQGYSLSEIQQEIETIKSFSKNINK